MQWSSKGFLLKAVCKYGKYGHMHAVEEVLHIHLSVEVIKEHKKRKLSLHQVKMNFYIALH